MCSSDLPPLNDGFGSAVPVGSTATGTVNGTNDWAGKESGEPDHAGSSGGASVWYQLALAADAPTRTPAVRVAPDRHHRATGGRQGRRRDRRRYRRGYCFSIFARCFSVSLKYCFGKAAAIASPKGWQ